MYKVIKFMKLFKNISVTFFTALITVMFIYGGYTIYAAGDEKVKADFRYAKDFYGAFDAYHMEMNDYFNSKIEKLNLLVEDNGFYQNPEKKKNFLPPANIIDKDNVGAILSKCGEDNVSTYCVSIGALDKYTGYLRKLDELKNSLDFSGGDSVSKNELIASLSQNKQQFNAEVFEARKVMEGTAQAYNEFRLSYPMHRKYEEIITQLVKYKLALKDIRKRVAQFPQKFIDATTSQCK